MSLCGTPLPPSASAQWDVSQTTINWCLLSSGHAGPHAGRSCECAGTEGLVLLCASPAQGGDFSAVSPQNIVVDSQFCLFPSLLCPGCCEGGGLCPGGPGSGPWSSRGFFLLQFLQRAEGFELLKPAQLNPELAPAQLCMEKNTGVGAWAVASSPLQEPFLLPWERFISLGVL